MFKFEILDNIAAPLHVKLIVNNNANKSNHDESDNIIVTSSLT